MKARNDLGVPKARRSLPGRIPGDGMKYALLIAIMCGCEGLTTPPQPAISVLKRMPEGCFALMTPATPPADALNLYGTCSYQADATLMANVDEAVVVIDYGPDVEFDATSAVPPPVVTVTIDGAPADVPVTVGDVQRVGSRAFFEATLRAPGQLSSDVRIAASVNAGFAASVDQPFAVIAPPVGLSFAECPDPASCELAGAVGNAHLVIDIPGDLSQGVVIHSQINGIEEAQPLDASVTPPETTVAIPVPAAPDGSTWTLSAHLGTAAAPSVSATIIAPLITAQLSCAPSCSLATGNPVGLEIDAPKGIAATQALVTTRLNGVPQLVAEPVALVPDPGGSATGLLALTVPGRGTWTIDVTVAGYAAPAIVQSIP